MKFKNNKSHKKSKQHAQLIRDLGPQDEALLSEIKREIVGSMTYMGLVRKVCDTIEVSPRQGKDIVRSWIEQGEFLRYALGHFGREKIRPLNTTIVLGKVISRKDTQVEIAGPNGEFPYSVANNGLVLLPGDEVYLEDSPEGYQLAGLKARHFARKGILRHEGVYFRDYEIPYEALMGAKYCSRGQWVEVTSDYEDTEESVYTWVEAPINVTPIETESHGLNQTASTELTMAAEVHQIPIAFSEAALEEAKALPEAVRAVDRRGRADYRSVPFVTIDGEDSRDFDDAVYAEDLPDGETLLRVAIADVSHYVKPGSALEHDVQERCTSVYFPTSVVPMLPEKLSNGLCSLNPHEDRLAMVVSMHIRADGTIDEDSVVFEKGVICSHGRLTYTQVLAAINAENLEQLEAQKALGSNWKNVETLYRLYKKLRQVREARHALDFHSQETKVVLNDKEEIVDFEVRTSNDAYRLIEEMMLAANVCAAKFVIDHKRMTLFRVHDEPAPDRVNDIRSLLKSLKVNHHEISGADWAYLVDSTKDYPYIQMQILRCMARAEYSPTNIGHFGLQYERYAHFTSPIRRYPDLLLHRVIKGILARRKYHPEIEIVTDAFKASRHRENLGENNPYHSGIKKENAKNTPALRSAQDQKDWLVWEELGQMCSIAERRADDATRDVMNWLQCQWMQKNERKRFKAVITGVIEAGIFVQLEGKTIEGFVHVSNLNTGEWFEFDNQQMKGEFGTTLKIGDRVEVRAETIDMERRRISFVVTNILEHAPFIGKETEPKREKKSRDKRPSFVAEDEAFFDFAPKKRKASPKPERSSRAKRSPAKLGAEEGLPLTRR